MKYELDTLTILSLKLPHKNKTKEKEQRSIIKPTFVARCIALSWPTLPTTTATVTMKGGATLSTVLRVPSGQQRHRRHHKIYPPPLLIVLDHHHHQRGS